MGHSAVIESVRGCDGGGQRQREDNAVEIPLRQQTATANWDNAAPKRDSTINPPHMSTTDTEFKATTTNISISTRSIYLFQKFRLTPPPPHPRPPPSTFPDWEHTLSHTVFVSVFSNELYLGSQACGAQMWLQPSEAAADAFFLLVLRLRSFAPEASHSGRARGIKSIKKKKKKADLVTAANYSPGVMDYLGQFARL